MKESMSTQKLTKNKKVREFEILRNKGNKYVYY